jgi:hypothetical protein
VEESLRSGLLRQAGDFYVEPGKADYLVYNRQRRLSQEAICFRDWLLADCQGEL